ncbi:YhgE/Pip domain-containing protein [Sporolactobacillus putidus]|uniref:ABC-2 type transporter transmembrane domain-containing protein n=1 Tax=Sporolactobacillus putidus TaxID=492735 RepID=A0A917S1F1_9BACL|nr:ABC transporter permease [Sporolactobacillus putidus]GGL48619.1 hypothetical protein GCM10007968_11000 [Sporolactobacillus putidus]
MKTLKEFLKYSETYLGIATALVFMLIFFCVWMTAYNGVTDRTNHLKIGLVNEDKQIGATLEENLKKNLPFDVKTYQSIHAAKQEMNQRKLDMVMEIPESFSKDLQSKGTTDVKYFINQANSSLAKQIMNGTAGNITQAINGNVYNYKQNFILSHLSGQMNAVIPSKNLSQAISNNIAQALKSLTIDSVHSSIVKTNNTDGFPATMVPLLVVLASFVGSMIMSLNLNGAAIKMRQTFDKWSIFLARQIINIGASVLLAAVTLTFMAIFNIDLKTSLLETGMFQMLVYFSFLSLTQMFVVLFGPAGMLFNILTMALQLVTSGVIVPKAMLSDFYQTIAAYFPATYVADGYYTVIFGGVRLSGDLLPLAAISGAALLVAMIRVLFQKNKSLVTNPIEQKKVQTVQ